MSNRHWAVGLFASMLCGCTSLPALYAVTADALRADYQSARNRVERLCEAQGGLRVAAPFDGEDVAIIRLGEFAIPGDAASDLTQGIFSPLDAAAVQRQIRAGRSVQSFSIALASQLTSGGLTSLDGLTGGPDSANYSIRTMDEPETGFFRFRSAPFNSEHCAFARSEYQRLDRVPEETRCVYAKFIAEPADYTLPRYVHYQWTGVREAENYRVRQSVLLDTATGAVLATLTLFSTTLGNTYLGSAYSCRDATGNPAYGTYILGHPDFPRG